MNGHCDEEVLYNPEYDEWAPLGYDGYAVSKSGRVMGPGRHGEGHLLKPWIAKSGYYTIRFGRGKDRVTEYVHRLVKQTFEPVPECRNLEVRHLDDDPSNNKLENLEWGTQKDNMQDAIRNRTFYYLSKEDIRKANEARETPVVAVSLRTGEILRFRSQQEAGRVLDIEQSSINASIANRIHHAGGYKFYKDDGSDPKLDIENYRWTRMHCPVKATNIYTGEEIIFSHASAASRELGMSEASVCNVLRHKQSSSKGYSFEYYED